MRKIITTCILALAAISANAQISIGKTDFASPGDTLFYTWDTTDININMDASAGAGKTWDYSTLTRNLAKESWFVDPSASPVPAPANITHVFIDGDVSETSFMNATDTALYNIRPNPGFSFVGGDQFLGLRSLRFPLNYPDVNTDSIRSVSIVPGASIFLGALADSVRVTISIQLNSTCDGWGTLITPKATYNSTLRIKNTIVSTFKFEGKKAPFPIWFPIPVSALPLPIPAKQTEVSYGWLGTASKYFIAESNMVTDTPGKRDFLRWQTDRPINSGLFRSVRNNIEVNAYPNPASSDINLQFFLANASEMNVAIYNLSGQLVKTLSEKCMAGQNLLHVDAAELATGLYQVILSGNGKSAALKVNVK